jgi:hypothetical protein
MMVVVVVVVMMVVMHRGSRSGGVRSRRRGVRVWSRRILSQRGSHHEPAREAERGDEFGHMFSNSIRSCGDSDDPFFVDAPELRMNEALRLKSQSNRRRTVAYNR